MSKFGRSTFGQMESVEKISCVPNINFKGSVTSIASSFMAYKVRDSDILKFKHSFGRLS